MLADWGTVGKVVRCTTPRAPGDQPNKATFRVIDRWEQSCNYGSTTKSIHASHLLIKFQVVPSDVTSS